MTRQDFTLLMCQLEISRSNPAVVGRILGHSERWPAGNHDHLICGLPDNPANMWYLETAISELSLSIYRQTRIAGRFGMVCQNLY